MAKAWDRIKASFNKAADKLDNTMDNYHNTFAVGTVAGYGLLGTGAYTAVVTYTALSMHIGAGLAGMMGFIAASGTMMMGGAFVVAPLVAATFATEKGVKIYKSRQQNSDKKPVSKPQVVAV